MKRILMILVCTLLLCSCSMNTKTESKKPQTIATRNECKQPKKLEVEQTSKLKNWDIKVIPRLDHEKWVYDTKIKFLGDKTVNLTVLNYDKTNIKYKDVKPQIPLETFGSYDYEGSVYSRKNNHLSFTLKWSEGTSKVYTGVIKVKVNPKN